MDRLTGMEVFVRVVDKGGFTAAAEASGMSTTMVSNHIQELERRLGARLLNRTTRRHSLTEIGKAFYDQCIDILTRIDGAETEAREMRSEPRGRLRVSAPVSLGSHLLLPLLADYFKAYPRVEVELMLNDRLVDLADEGFDAVFRFGKLGDVGLVARPLRGLGRIVCASPAYLAEQGTPRSPEELASHNCLCFHYIQPEREWRFDKPKSCTISVSGQLTVNNGPALLMAALGGIGIVMLPDFLVANDIASGRLVQLFPEEDFSRAPLQLVYLPDRYMTPKLRSFVDFVVEHLA
ncbi:LysR family transcriptional regulator [Caballeronia sp. LjRoot34]|uniref:LysR family transcriptional regulator n=1 Tax=Caballeronia sp. LjRoot34 TaxID=3342325 RepID=UPI003ED15E55